MKQQSNEYDITQTMHILRHISTSSYILGVVHNRRTTPFQRKSFLSVGELKESFVEEARPEKVLWHKWGFGGKRRGHFRKGHRIGLT